jgi:ubiquinone/menaquinone biosynthesis C-methylase UbiE
VKTLTREEARRVYDRIGSLQDTQAFYEDRATDELIRAAALASAQSVFELGCGTGRFAERILRSELPPTATYRGIDLSPNMVRLAKSRLVAFGSRAEVHLSNGEPPVGEPSAAYDRFVSNYVVDLLSEDDAIAVVREAHRMLRPGGLLCLCSLTHGVSLPSRMLLATWSALYSIRPSLVGGCRPVSLRELVSGDAWEIVHHARVSSFAVPCEVVIARPRSTGLVDRE